MVQLLRDLRKKVSIGFVGGSDLDKIKWQLQVDGLDAIHDFDFAFAENGLTAYRLGKQLGSQSFIEHLGEDNYKYLVNFLLKYLSEIDIPIKRGTFIEYRNGMVNVSPIGRNASKAERDQFVKDDEKGHFRENFVKALRQNERLAGYNLTYSIGGQISFDVFPNGWDKTYALRHVEAEGFEEIHFFGDKTSVGGNDHEIYEKIKEMYPNTSAAHAVKSPADTIRICKQLFLDV
ncbi:hypothetical protein PILCRDRAFT_828007 [Piloderma croceum F 1598]|uniref:Phosphomannomutase n=1 Tax=Piloderma croceum (strain F 1598) TaxID=765440 RepID=A0A0C3F486_PILCF|nr:hypothetical protein PILCRDRAFT_828007 [Piloderma croceum F 1598]